MINGLMNDKDGSYTKQLLAETKILLINSTNVYRRVWHNRHHRFRTKRLKLHNRKRNTRVIRVADKDLILNNCI